MSSVVLVSGTHGAKNWASPGTKFRKLLESYDVEVLPGPEWDEEVEGVPSIYHDRPHGGWIAGGYGVQKDAEDRPFEERNYIAHSYGGCVMAYGIARPLCPPIHHLITVGTPYREDMVKVWLQASKKIGFHLHICDPKPPFIEVVAQFFDSRWGKARAGHPTANRVEFVKGMKHSRILDDEKGMVREWTAERPDGPPLISYLTNTMVPGERVVA